MEVIAMAGLGLLALFAGIILLGDRKGDRESKAASSYVRGNSRKSML